MIVLCVHSSRYPRRALSSRYFCRIDGFPRHVSSFYAFALCNTCNCSWLLSAELFRCVGPRCLINRANSSGTASATSIQPLIAHNSSAGCQHHRLGTPTGIVSLSDEALEFGVICDAKIQNIGHYVRNQVSKHVNICVYIIYCAWLRWKPVDRLRTHKRSNRMCVSTKIVPWRLNTCLSTLYKYEIEVCMLATRPHWWYWSCRTCIYCCPKHS